ncbi:Uncharacterized protein HZ326_2075 [Fusarium oxysporum f. sp. albedinis]|nr:Uncharacterized protein HZ326_2075 [Fusarium oxysporum f. sp. albedinis]
MTLPCDSNNATASPSPKRTYSLMRGNIPRLFFWWSFDNKPGIRPVLPTEYFSTNIPLALFPIEALQRTAVFTRSADPSPP